MVGVGHEGDGATLLHAQLTGRDIKLEIVLANGLTNFCLGLFTDERTVVYALETVDLETQASLAMFAVVLTVSLLIMYP